MPEVRPIVWKKGQLHLLDQRKLPSVETYLQLTGARDTAKAIKAMVVRGAPAIGVTAGFGMAMEARRFRATRLHEDFIKAKAILAAARPTAVNLVWALERQEDVLARFLASTAKRKDPVAALAKLMEREARSMLAEDIDVNRRLGEHGRRVLAKHVSKKRVPGKEGDVMTHCNAGALATGGYGTAIGVIRAAWEKGGGFEVVASETRPFLQGARLTAWELKKLRIPVTLVTDGMVGHLMQSGRIGAVVVGTDRTAANGDVCNKIGTYTIAVMAHRHGVPFYVAAPTSSIDLSCQTGADIPIEQRDPKEITHIGGRRVATEGIDVFNPAFDVTPAELVTGIITEEGVVRGDYENGLSRAVRAARKRWAK